MTKFNVPTATLIDGTSIPLLAWGCGTGPFQKDASLATTAGEVALKAGIVHIDTAQSYHTEAESAGALDKSGIKREDVYITTKISEVETTPEAIRAQVNDSLSKLGTKPDLILIHNPFVPAHRKIGEFWTILEDLVYDGTLEGVSLGISNFRPQDLDDVWKVARIKPAVHQIEYHPFVLKHLEPIIAHAKTNSTVLEAYGPLTPLLRHPTGGPLKPILDKIAKRLSDESNEEVDATGALLKWTLQKGVVAVTGSTNPGRIQKLSAVQKLPDLTEEEIKEIDQTGEQVHYRHYREHMEKDFPTPDLPPGHDSDYKQSDRSHKG